jgi:hypothetical protein
MAFKIFTGAGKRIGKPMVSIWSRGQIGLNQGAMKKYKLENYDYVILLFDEETRRVGFVFTNDDNKEGAIKITKRTTGFSFSANAFLNSYGIDHDNETKKYTLEYDSDNNIYIFDTNKQINKKGG